ncbi:hypothetical protein Vadar_025341 [Vaccinium darrowii]|uniref:Uncharacterized protein n=1 Tax=Vaccinium darrowii TaxID=229202 RepID=A0ACB7ZDM0_9ERIC|nr:hypothetical protein Vadar_025341 [Vaccinium darrowii]
MAVGLRLWLCLWFGFAMICYARNTISFSGEEAAVLLKTMEGRSLQVSLNDYREASANNGHDPRIRVGGNNGGQRSRDNP